MAIVEYEQEILVLVLPFSRANNDQAELNRISGRMSRSSARLIYIHKPKYYKYDIFNQFMEYLFSF